MPHRTLAVQELADLLGALSHPHRLRIVIELRESERDVNSLQGLLKISHSGVSQHLAVLRAHRVVAERRAGRHVYYHLVRPELAHWVVEGLRVLEATQLGADELKSALEQARAEWEGRSR